MATIAQVEPQEIEKPADGQPDEGAEEAANPKDLLKDLPELQNVVKELAKHFMGLDKWPRRQEVIETRRQRYYWRGVQYIYWKNDSVGFMPVVAGQNIQVENENIDISRYTDVYNIFTPFGESLISTLIQNPPGINWQPEDMAKAVDITASQTAEKYQQKVEKDNDRKSLQLDVARFFYTDGRTVLYTRREGDVDLITAHGVLESKVIPMTVNRREDLVFASVSDEIDVYQAKDKYKDYKDKISKGSASLGESSYERIARLGVLQGTRAQMQSGDAFEHVISRHQIFLRPSTFEKISKKEDKDQILAIFPDGIKAIFCGDAYCGSENVSMDDQLTIRWPGPGDGMNRQSMGARMVPLQDVFNDEINLWHEAHDYCVPTLFMYSETGDIDAIREQSSAPGTVVPFTSLPPGATSAASAFYAAVLEGIPDTLPKFIEFVQGPLAQFISGAFPALFGGDTGDNDTAKGISIQRDQAMGRMGLPWGSLQELFAGAYLQAVRSAVKNAGDGDKFNFNFMDRAGNPVNEELSMADLKAGNFKCSPDADASFPETTNSKKQTFQLLMTAAERNPLLAEVISQPDNMEFGWQVIGLPDLVVPGAIARNKQLIEIDQLLKESPVPPSIDEIKAIVTQQGQAGDQNLLKKMAEWEQEAQAAQAAGKEPPPMPIPDEMMEPSIEIDAACDFNKYEWQAVQDWLSSPERRKQDMKNNHQGVLNVRLHGLKHQQAYMMEQAAMSGAGAPPSTGPRQAAPILDKNAAGAQPHTAPPAQ